MPALRLLVALVATAVATAAPLALAADDLVRVLTGGTGAVYYPLASALADAVGKAMPNARASVQATKTSTETLNLLQAGRGEVGFALGDALSSAWRGNEDSGFKAPLARLRGIAALFPNYVQIVARADSGVRTLADLRGKKISVGAPKSATETNARAILAAAGLAYKDFAKVEYLPFGESVELMKNRQIDVTLQSASLRVLALRDLAASLDVVVVPITPEVIARIKDPAYLPAVIPAKTYRGQAADVPTAAIENYLVTQEGVDADTVYGVTRALWTRLDLLTAAHPAAKTMDLRKALEGMPVPLHPGAEKYYREVGVIP